MDKNDKHNTAQEVLLKRIKENKENQYLQFSITLKENTDFPEEFWDLIHLTHLSIRYTNIKELPQSINKLVNLKGIDITHSSIENFPEDLSALINLTHFRIEHHSKPLSEALLSSIATIPNLHCLHLQNNNMSMLVEAFKQLNNLRTLELSYNKFYIFPLALTYLSGLHQLDISHNHLKYIPSEIKNMKNLKLLNLDDNEITALPSEIADLRQIKSLNIDSNPFDEMPEIKDMGHADMFVHLDSLRGVKTYATIWEIPDFLTTAFKQYLNYFKDFVKKMTGENIQFEAISAAEGLKLTTTTTEKITIEDINGYLEIYLTQSRENAEAHVNKKLSSTEQLKLQLLLSEWEQEKQQLNHKVDMLIHSNRYLEYEFNMQKKELKSAEEYMKEQRLMIRFFQEQNEHLLKLIPQPGHKLKVELEMLPPPPPQLGCKAFDAEQFLLDLMEILTKISERKYTHSLEDLHNDFVVDFLRAKGYIVTDQYRSGRSLSAAGEIDILIRNINGTPESIVEAFRAKSCGATDKNISRHIKKLLLDYDTIGHETNFVIVYVEQKDFFQFWENYHTYIQQMDLGEDCTLISFEGTKISKKTNIKIGIAKHKRAEEMVKVYHVLVHFYANKNE